MENYNMKYFVAGCQPYFVLESKERDIKTFEAGAKLPTF